MAKETPNPSHELALVVLEAAAKEGALSETHKARLAELTGQGVRSNVTETLVEKSAKPVANAPAIIIAQPKDVQELVENLRLEEGYAEAVETQKFFDLLKPGEKAPDFGQVLKVFTPEMLAAALKFQNPELRLITKDRSFNDLVAAMNAHKTVEDQNNVIVDGAYSKHATQIPANWSAHIIEAAVNPEVQEFDDSVETLDERLERFDEYKKTAKVGGMDRLKYAHLMMQALKAGRSIDDKLWTMLDEDPLTASSAPCASWTPAGRRVRFIWLSPRQWHINRRFRRSVGGVVPNV